MILLLIGLIVLGAIGVMCMYADNLFQECVGVASMVIAALGLMTYCFLVFDWVGSKYKTEIINREYGTDYTRYEIFYASDVIDEIRELNRKRVEINGDLFKNDSN